MASSPAFEGIWSRYRDFAVSAPNRPKRCEFAEQFGAWTEELLAPILMPGHQPTVEAIYRTKVLLADRYMEWRSTVPKSHRDRTAPAGRGGHECIFAVFVGAYEQLRQAQLAVAPPRISQPGPAPSSPPVPASAPQIAGIFIGEEK
jgi:hypothetical protein